MKRAFYFPLAALILAACQQEQLLSPSADGSLLAISDGANNGGNPDFWFLPPVVSNPQGLPGFDRDEFNPNVRPVVRICSESDVDSAERCPVPGAVEGPAALDEDHYYFDWKTSSGTLGVYRVEVVLAAQRLGFFDVELSGTGRSGAGNRAAVKAGSTVPVKFSIENSALCWNQDEEAFTGLCVSQTVDLSQGSVVALSNGNNIDIPAQNETDQVTTITLRPCDDLNPRVLDLPTFGDCLSIGADPPLERDLTVPAIVSICTLDPSALGLSPPQQDFVTLHRLDPGPAVAALPHAVANCDTQLGGAGSTTFIGDFQSDFQFALPGKIVKVAGDDQVGAPGEPVEIPPAVRVIIELGDGGEQSTVIPVPNARVTFAVGEGNGEVSSSLEGGASLVHVTTDAEGFAAVGSWSLGDPGSNTLHAFGRGIGTEGAFVPENSHDTETREPVDVALPPASVVFTATAEQPAEPVQTGRIVVNHDEWTLSTFGYGVAGADAAQFARNVADWFTGGQPGNFLAYSTNIGLTGTQLATTMTDAGHTWTVSTAVTFTLDVLLQYDAVFLASTDADNQILIDYVNAGGNVYLAGGTGILGAAGEAARWNTFLNAFGLAFGSPYNGVAGVVAIASDHPIFAGVTGLYQENGSPISDLTPEDASSTILVFHQTGGLYAVYEQQ